VCPPGCVKLRRIGVFLCRSALFFLSWFRRTFDPFSFSRPPFRPTFLPDPQEQTFDPTHHSHSPLSPSHTKTIFVNFLLLMGPYRAHLIARSISQIEGSSLAANSVLLSEGPYTSGWGVCVDLGSFGPVNFRIRTAGDLGDAVATLTIIFSRLPPCKVDAKPSRLSTAFFLYRSIRASLDLFFILLRFFRPLGADF